MVVSIADYTSKHIGHVDPRLDAAKAPPAWWQCKRRAPYKLKAIDDLIYQGGQRKSLQRQDASGLCLSNADKQVFQEVDKSC